MDMGIVNAQQVEADKYELIDKELLEFVEDVLLNRRASVPMEPSLTSTVDSMRSDRNNVSPEHRLKTGSIDVDRHMAGMRAFGLWRCRCENSTERLLEYAATLEPKSKPTNVKKLGANSCPIRDYLEAPAYSGKRTLTLNGTHDPSFPDCDAQP